MANQLEELLSRMATDEEFLKKVKEDKQVLAELGWDPEAIASFELADKGYWGCGTECGCTASMGQGCSAKSGHACSGGSGTQIK
ncbi:MAG: hypothetical protein KAS86_02550 [Candidatus Omnitrophica bacterium]|nr:hypothetical protein [Candidatus Omnitrophota bacterium]